MKPTAVELSTLLAARHSDGIYVPECKMGQVGSRTLDGWALLPTWSPLTSIGYEIKVSRSDWLQDQKFEEYRSACHLFYVVAPKGIVSVGELPGGVGLLEPIGQGTGRRLVMRVKSIRQEPDAAKLVRLMAHVLMWRKDMSNGFAQSRERRAAFWRAFVEEKKDFHVVGQSVKGRMRSMLKEAIDGRRLAEFKAEQLDEARIALEELGVKPGHDRWVTRRNIEAALRQGANETIADLSTTIERLANLRNRVYEASQRAITE